MCVGVKKRVAWNKGLKGIFVGEKAANWKGGRRIDKNGYILIYSPNHPYARKWGKTKYVAEHRLIIERHLGRYLKPEEAIHHLNGVRNDNRLENLELFANHSDHIKQRHRENGLRTQFKYGQVSWLKGKKLSSSHREKVIKTLIPFKKGHPYYPRKVGLIASA